MVLDGSDLCFSIVAVCVWVVSICTVHCVGSDVKKRDRDGRGERGVKGGEGRERCEGR